MNYHLKAFEEIAGSLAGYTKKVVISFVDFYAKIQRNIRELGIRHGSCIDKRLMEEISLQMD